LRERGEKEQFCFPKTGVKSSWSLFLAARFLLKLNPLDKEAGPMKKYAAPIVRRRDMLSLATVGTAALAIDLAIDAVLPEAATAAPSDAGGKRRARYQANSSEVKNFYRVNRYPAG
jgi:hypothetical protein